MTAGGASTAWTWRHAIIKSELPATTRHVLLTVSMHMNELGEGCYPTVEMLVEETGLSKRSVLTHLQAGIDAGWLVRLELGLRGRKWRRCEYRSRWPDRGEAVVDDYPGDDHPAGGDAADADRDASRGAEAEPADREDKEGGEPAAPHGGDDVVNDVHHLAEQGGERAAPEVVNVLHHYRKTSRDLSIEEREGALARDRSDELEGPSGEDGGRPEREPNKPQEARSGDAATGTQESRARSGGGAEATGKQGTDDLKSSQGQTVLDMIALYPAGRQDQRGQVVAAWNALTPTERQRAIDELPGWLDERTAAKLRRMFLQTYLGEKQFDLPKGIGAPGKGAKGAKSEGGHLTFANWSREWFGHLVWCASNGRPFATMVNRAATDMRGRWGCRIGEMPSAQALSTSVKVWSGSPEWQAWEAWLRERDKRAAFPSWERGAWFELPSAWPPGHQEARSGAAATGNETHDANDYPAELEI